MARYIYTAEKTGGEEYRGVADARDRFELYEVVRREGGKILTLEQDTSKSWFSLSYWNALINTVSEYDKILVTRNLGAMLSAGLSLARALAVIQRQSKNPKLQSVLGEVEDSVRHGDPFNQALKKFPNIFPKLMVAMVRAGEEGGNLAKTLLLVSSQLERMYLMKKRIKSAMTYPIIVLIAIGGIGALMMTQVVPTLAKSFKEMKVELPASTRSIMWASDMLSQHTLPAVAVIVVVVAILYVSLRTEKGRKFMNFTILYVPNIGQLVREINAVRVARTLSSLMGSGISVLTSLEITRDVVQNVYFKEVVTDAMNSVSAGEALSKAFMRREDLYPSFIGEMMSVGEETGQTVEMLDRIATYYEDEVDRKMKDMSTIIEPILMLFIGAAVGFFAVAMITPIYSITETI